MEQNEKEILTMAKCRREMRCHLKDAYFGHLIIVLEFSLLFGLIHLLLAIAFGTQTRLLLLWIPPALSFAGAVFLVIKEWVWIEKTAFTLVEDTLSGSNEIATERKSHRPSYTYITYHWEFYFGGRGQYRATGVIAPWSIHHMSAKDLFRSSEKGDPFYLLLDKPGKSGEQPRILLAYPCKFFTWQENT